MTRETIDGRINGVDATVAIEDGRITVEDQTTGTLRVESPNHKPLSTRECHLSLRVAEGDVRVRLDLDGEGLDALADAIHHARGVDGQP